MIHPNYANQNLQNRSFKRLDLSGADFSGSDLRGCDFTGTNLAGANLTGIRTGLSRRQVNRLMVVAILGPALIIGLCILAVQIPASLLGDRFYQGINYVVGGLPIVLLFLEMLFRDRVTSKFSRMTNLMGVASVALLFQIMAAFTISLGIVSILSFDSGAGAQGLFLLVLAVISAIVTRRIFKWVTQSIHSSCGTSFRKANLTNANLSQAVIQNTDFCYAVLTGSCIFDWTIQHHTQFTNVACEYVYLDSAQQKRHPAESKFRQGEAEAYLSGAPNLFGEISESK